MANIERRRDVKTVAKNDEKARVISEKGIDFGQKWGIKRGLKQ
jgi:hypothetical protein